MNKKKIFGSLAIIAIAAVMTINVNFSSKNSELLDISLSNVEALANETGSGCKWRTTVSCGGGWALCDCDGYGSGCNCGDAKWYPN